jgi:hypothetical protein
MTKTQRTRLVLGLPLGAALLAGVARADEAPATYLVGTWALGSLEACDAATGEHLTFAADGTFVATLHGAASATGFWQLDGHELELHLVAAPAVFDDPASEADDVLAGLAGQYTYYYAKGLTFDIEPDAFRTVVVMGDIMRGADLHRCP